jgi:hypothetical protein
MSDFIMFISLGFIGYLIYRVNTNKPLIPGMKTKAKTDKRKKEVGPTKELEGDWKSIIGIKNLVGDHLLELVKEGETRTFVGAVRTEPINYQLRSLAEQAETDRAFERLLASLSLGPGREVKFSLHVQSRPIELVDQMKLYYDTYPTLQPVAQRYAQSIFFPYMEQWQGSVDEYNYVRYIFIILDYTDKMTEGMDEDVVYSKALNEYTRLANNIVGGYGRMGGVSRMSTQIDLLEAMYFATHKQSGSVEGFRSIFKHPGRLLNVVMSDFSTDREANRFLDEEFD